MDSGILASAYKLSRPDRTGLLDLAELAGLRSLADDLDLVTAHSMRKSTATILEDAGQTPRQVADQLGHAQTSTTVDDYFGGVGAIRRALSILRMRFGMCTSGFRGGKNQSCERG
ncbi:hypothetical protein [Kribbella solani]|uniref:Integrase n=1 Tax=Kribbella solani TaxID=236067 RepID=A0A841DN67_9ACTN|nr:hypothetical protein [Kribbella solani]MBB5980574.1 integrase [Kribbella solani]